MAHLVQEVRLPFQGSSFWANWKIYWSNHGGWTRLSPNRVLLLEDVKQLWYGKSLFKILSYYGAVRGQDIGNWLYSRVLDAIAPDVEHLYGQNLNQETKSDIIESFLGFMYLARRFGQWDPNESSRKRIALAREKIEELCYVVYELASICSSQLMQSMLAQLSNASMQSSSAVPV